MSGKAYYADVQLQITVKFTDNGEGDLKDQAMEAVWEHDFSPFDTDAEIIGPVRESETP